MPLVLRSNSWDHYMFRPCIKMRESTCKRDGHACIDYPLALSLKKCWAELFERVLACTSVSRACATQDRLEPDDVWRLMRRPFDAAKQTSASGGWEWVDLPQSVLLNNRGIFYDCAMGPLGNTKPVSCNPQAQYIAPGRSAAQPWASPTNQGTSRHPGAHGMFTFSNTMSTFVKGCRFMSAQVITRAEAGCSE